MTENMLEPLSKIAKNMSREEMVKLLEKKGVKMKNLYGYNNYEPGDIPVGTTYFTFNGENINLGMNYVEQIIFDGISNNKTTDMRNRALRQNHLISGPA